MNKFIEQKIIELQNSKTATEITQNAKYFINILAENERLTKQLENAVVLPCKVGDTVYWLYTEGATGWSNAIKKCQVSKISISSHYTEIHSERTSLNDMNLWGIMGKDVFLLEDEAIARLAELGGKE